MSRPTSLPARRSTALLMRTTFATTVVALALTTGTRAHAQQLRLPAPGGLPGPALIIQPPVIVGPVVVAPAVAPPRVVYPAPLSVERPGHGHPPGHYKHRHKHKHGHWHD